MERVIEPDARFSYANERTFLAWIRTALGLVTAGAALPGDAIFTGTPAGVGITSQPSRFLHPGSTLVTWIEGIGEITNRCVAPQA